MAVVLAFKATTGSPFAPVTTANAFKGRAIGSDMLVAEAPQAIGRTLTLAYSGDDAQRTPIAFGGFSTQSRADLLRPNPVVRTRCVARSRLPIRPLGMRTASLMSPPRSSLLPGHCPKVVASVTETSSITKQAAPGQAAEAREAPAAKKAPKARVAAVADEEDAKPRKSAKKKSARKSDDDEDSGKSERRRSRREVASYEERRSYNPEREYGYRSRYAQVERNYGSGGAATPAAVRVS